MKSNNQSMSNMIISIQNFSTARQALVKLYKKISKSLKCKRKRKIFRTRFGVNLYITIHVYLARDIINNIIILFVIYVWFSAVLSNMHVNQINYIHTLGADLLWHSPLPWRLAEPACHAYLARLAGSYWQREWPTFFMFIFTCEQPRMFRQWLPGEHLPTNPYVNIFF